MRVFSLLLLACLVSCQKSAADGKPNDAPAPTQMAAAPVPKPPQAPAPSAKAPKPEQRRFEFAYSASFGDGPATGPVDVFIPVAQSDEHQTIHSMNLDSPSKGEFGTETRHGNRYWHARVSKGELAGWSVSVRYEVTRKARGKPTLGGEPRELTPSEQQKLSPYLKENSKVPVNVPVLKPILAEIQARLKSDATVFAARAIYDWVIDNMEYKKTGTGWGNGDTYWACSEKYGNCTDFHSLFISLARSMSIPARFEMGFPVPVGGGSGSIKGYHCWLQFYRPGSGWVPADASEAKKHPELREELYGAQPADRLRFSVGRDLRLGKAHRAPALNYFIYPHVEVDGVAWTKKLKTKFQYRELP